MLPRIALRGCKSFRDGRVCGGVELCPACICGREINTWHRIGDSEPCDGCGLIWRDDQLEAWFNLYRRNELKGEYVNQWGRVIGHVG